MHTHTHTLTQNTPSLRSEKVRLPSALVVVPVENSSNASDKRV